MVQNLAAPVDPPWAAYEWLQAASDASGTLDRRESVPTCRSFAAEVELHPELFPSETADSGLDASSPPSISVSQRMKRSSLISRGSAMAQER
jgi:hypothetical protein